MVMSVDTSTLHGHKTMQRAKIIRDNNLYFLFRSVESSEGTMVTVDGAEQIMISSNNYLGLTHHPLVVEAAKRVIDQYGTGCTGSRVLNGNLVIHEELEERLAKYLGHQAALVFSTGMQANLGALSAVCGPKDCMIMDSENHVSLIDAGRLSFGHCFKYKHNDMQSLEAVLRENAGRYRHTWVVTDGVFSTTGDIVNLPRLVQLAEQYSAHIYLDDAHGIGVMGERGRGTMHHFGIADRITLNMGTFSKSFASIGGVVSGSAELIDYIKHNARSFIFSAAMSPSAVATVMACLDVIDSDATLYSRLWKNVEFMRQSFAELGLYTYNSQTPVIPVLVGDELKTFKITEFLQQNGIFATPLLPPAVPKGESSIRTSYMATHSMSELTKVVEVFAKVKKRFDLPTQLHH